MAENLMAKMAESVLGHSDQDRATNVDISNPDREGHKYADEIETSKPRIIEDHDAIVRVTGTTICGSDVHIMHAAILQVEKGDILGHEFCGVIEAVGPANLITACEKTNASTVHEKLYGSRMGGIFGYSHFTGGYAGGQAEFVRVPLADNNLLRLPHSVPDEKGLYLSDVLPTSYHSVYYTGVKANDCVAIWGLGPIGLMACVWAFKMGAKRVIAIDNNWRTEYAKSKIEELETINYTTLASDETVSSKIHEMVPGGVDVSIDATGGEYAKGWAHKLEIWAGLEQDTSEMINECIRSTRKFGAVGIIGDYVGNWEDLLYEVENLTIDPTIMLTHRFKIDDIAKGYYVQEKREKGLVKCFVETRFSARPAPDTPELTIL
ncbi:hypothetical protein QYS62_011476 [Fusarium acuminatum]|uniref:Uncharacterized protein n=1 Tax=Fusarium acuminatum TaxID=5515 RepID=A0ABZ2XAS9_9HYPO